MKSSLMGPLEQQIMDVLWEAGRSMKPQEVLGNLKGKHAYTTIMTVMKRMADKKMVSRKMSGKAYEYCPCQGRDIFVKNNLSGIFGDLVNDYGELAISQFVNEVKQNKEDLKLLKQYIENSK